MPLLGLLVLFGLVTAVWPALANAFELPSFGGGPSTRIPYEPEPISLEALKATLVASPLPASLAEAVPDTISPFIAIGVVTVVVVALIVGVGAVLSFLIKLLAGIRDNTLESETYQQHQQALEQRQKEKLTVIRDGRTTHPQPSHKMPRWSVVKPEFVSPPAGLIAREAFSGTRVRVGPPFSPIAARSGLSGEAAVPTKSPSVFAAPATGGVGKSISAPSLLPIRFLPRFRIDRLPGAMSAEVPFVVDPAPIAFSATMALSSVIMESPSAA